MRSRIDELVVVVELEKEVVGKNQRVDALAY